MGDITTNLSLYEIVPKREYDLVKKGSIPVFNIIDMKQALAGQNLIERYGSMLVNNYDQGLQFCGYRPSDCKEGATYSVHRLAKAYDFHPLKVTIAEIHADLLRNPVSFYDMGFTVVEDPSKTPSWFHGATPDTRSAKLIIVKP